jgi:hypothetical protein
MTRDQVEGLLGPAIRETRWADNKQGYAARGRYVADGQRVPVPSEAHRVTVTAHYTSRGDKGWDYDVVYDEYGVVIRTRQGYDRH